MQLVVLGLGSNKEFNGFSCLELLQKACDKLSKLLANFTISSVYKTKAMYYEDQQDFHNMVVLGYVDDNVNPYAFLERIHEIEALYGRNRALEIRFGPRSLDIDIELFGNWKIQDDILEIPHVRIKERAFVLIPLLEILPESADENIRKDLYDALHTLEVNGCTKDVEKIFLKAACNGTKNYSGS